jgi:hypothetical protein
MSIDYERFARYLRRCKEVADEPNMNPIVAAVYKEALDGPATTYLNAYDAMSKAIAAHEKEHGEAHKALAELDSPYRVARSAVMTMHPETVKALPDTLKSLPTDTDQLSAITRLLDDIDDYEGAPWADALLKGDFGVKAAAAIKEINEGIASNKALSAAQMERAKAYGPAYEKYLGFKRVVRNALGPGSKQYKRIHMRASPGAAGTADGGGEESSAPAGAPDAPQTP